jgi:glycosyltransferase involved in cell wall biosynthesis
MSFVPATPERLGVVTTSFPQHEADPAGSFVRTHLARWAEKAPGRRVDVVAVGPQRKHTATEQGDIYRVESRGLFTSAGAPETWESGEGFDRVRMLCESVRVTLALAHEIRLRCLPWTEVHSHWMVPSAVAVALVAPALRHTAYVHSADVSALESLPLARALLAWLLPRLSRVVCVSCNLAARLRTLAGDRWPVGLALDVEPMPAAVVGEGQLTPHVARAGVLGVGRLVPIKGFEVLLLAAAGLPRALRPTVTLLGEGPERARLHDMAKRLRLRLDLPGTVPPAEVAAAMARAKVCVIPSRILASGRTEGFPVVATEAIQSGTKLIASRVGGLAEVESNLNFQLVPPGDPTSLRVALAHALAM